MPAELPELPGVDEVLRHSRSGHGWVYRRRLAIFRAARREAAAALNAGSTIADATRAQIAAEATYDFPPYPGDREGYWLFRLRDLLGLTRRPPDG